MSADYSIDTLTDEERRLMDTIEADLDREMAVEPSADFAARVRARIASTPPRKRRAAGAPAEPEHDGGWSVPWTFAAAAVLTIATAILFAALRDAPRDPGSPAIIAGHDLTLPAPKPPAPIVPTSRTPDARLVRVARTQAATPPPAEPEVLVPPDFRLAIGRVMEMVRAGTLKEQAFPTPTSARTERAPGTPAEGATAVVEESTEPVAMVVEELHVPPINPSGGGVEKGFGLD